MSAIEAFTTSTTSILSARLSLICSPLADLAITVLPSTFSMTPLKRTVCGACAITTEAARSKAKALVPAINLVAFLIVISPSHFALN